VLAVAAEEVTQHSEAIADALAAQIADAAKLLNAWSGDLLEPIRHYVATYTEADAVQRELLALIARTQDDLDARIDAMRDALC
jgi:hypothetical protein